MVIRSVLVLLLALGGAARASDDAARCGTTGVALQVLGSGGPELTDDRASSSYLLWLNGRARVIVDIGGGAALRFGESGATLTDLDVILLTHLHVDHTADLPALIKSSFFGDRRDALPVLGPVGNSYFPSTTGFVRRLFAAPNGVYHYLDEFVSKDAGGAYLLEPRNLVLGAKELRKFFDRDGIVVTAATVVHGGVPAVAYRVELGNARVAFSGDTNGDNGNLEKLAAGADILVAHNAVPEGAEGVERALHMPPSVIGRIAHAAAVRQLVLSHRMRRTLGREQETETAIRAAYSGPLAFANDLDCYSIGPRASPP
jgi:ribonuclease BN (tRNA processing enzyme)